MAKKIRGSAAEVKGLRLNVQGSRIKGNVAEVFPLAFDLQPFAFAFFAYFLEHSHGK